MSTQTALSSSGRRWAGPGGPHGSSSTAVRAGTTPCRSMPSSPRAASTSRGPRRPGSQAQPHAQHALVQAQLQQQRRRSTGAGPVALDRPGRGDQALDAPARPATCAREQGLRTEASGPGPCGALGQRFDRAERSPGGRLRRKCAATIRRRKAASASSNSITSSSPSIPTAKAKGKRHPRFRMKPWLKLSVSPARRNNARSTASGRGARSAASLLACKNEYVLVIEPCVRLSPPLPLPAGNQFSKSCDL